MKKTDKQKADELMRQLLNHMLNGGKVEVKDEKDNVIKQSCIVALYSDYTIILGETIVSDYKISKDKLIPITNESKSK